MRAEKIATKQVLEKLSGARVVGIDIGSITTKAVLAVDGKIYAARTGTGIYMQETANEIINKLQERASIGRSSIKYIVGTGYGRVSLEFKDTPHQVITEISCHAKGAFCLHPDTRTIIDMGGQDCKAIHLDSDGNVIDFAMNDKCAAGTGRFLEVIANVFKVKLDNLGPLSLKGKEIVPISSTCTVFAESETISLLARGEKPENILGGIHSAISNRIAGMVSRVGLENDVFFSGGVAKNVGMKATLEKVLKVKILVPNFDPQLVGALGAAIFAAHYAAKEV